MGNWGYGAPTRGVMGPYHFVGDVFLWWSNVRGYDHPIFHGNLEKKSHSQVWQGNGCPSEKFDPNFWVQDPM